MESWFASHGQTDWIVRSYDHFLLGKKWSRTDDGGIRVTDGGLFEVFANLPVLELHGGVRARFGPPLIYPPCHPEHPTGSNPNSFLTYSECRSRNLTYAVSVRSFVSVDGSAKHESTFLGWIPLMVGSSAFPIERKDPSDTPGYFVVRGHERSLINVEQYKYYVPVYRARDKGTVQATIHSPTFKFSVTYSPKKSFLIWMPSRCKKPFYLNDLLYVLGKTDVEGTRSDDPREVLGTGFSHGIERSAEFVNKRIDDVTNEMFSFLGDDTESRIEFLEDVKRQLTDLHEGKRDETDRLSLEYKRIETCGSLLKDLTNVLMREQLYHLKRHAKTETDVDRLMLKYGGRLTKGLESSILTGKWTKGQQSVSRPIKRSDSHAQAASIIRRIDTPVRRESKDLSVREGHLSQYGFVCVSATPEGKNIGLIKNPCFTAEVTIEGEYDVWFKFLSSAGYDGPPYVYLNRKKCCSVSKRSYEYCRQIKRTKDPKASVSKTSEGHVYVDCSAGRLVRPVFVAGRHAEKGDWRRLVESGAVEYVDAVEQKSLWICDSFEPGCTHVELHPASLFSGDAARLPYCDHNQAPRVLFAACMGPQAIGVACLDPFRFDTEKRYTLNYPQKSSVKNDVARALGADDYPSGQNVTMMICAMPSNQEDSLVISKTFAELGGLSVTCEKSFEESLPYGCRFGKCREGAKYDSLDADGVIPVGSRVRSGTVLASAHRDGQWIGDLVHTDKLIFSGDYAEGLEVNYDVRYVHVVSKILRTIDEFGCERIAVKIAHTRPVAVGDKMASRHGQKGTVAGIYSREDLPFTREGITPDVVLNPHAIPSRMTIGHLIEMLCGKLVSLDPSAKNTCDSAPFSRDFDLTKAQRELKELGFHPLGEERVYCGKTGEMMESTIFTGVIYYQRLVHMVADKMHARSTGTNSMQTRQPLKGKKRDGGIRFGEMEKDSVVSHGAAHFLRDKYSNCSDGVDVSFCVECRSSDECVCGAERKQMRVPYSFLTLQMQLRASGINILIQ